jgi:chromosome segregation protein
MDEIRRTQKQKQKINKDVEQSQKELKMLLTSVQTLEKKISDLKDKREKDTHHLQLLEKMEKEERGPEAGRDTAEAIGFLADFIESDPTYTPLIDILWKEEAKARLIKAEDFLKTWDQRQLAGSFLLLHPERKGESEPQPPEDAGVLGRLKSHVRASPEIQDFYASLQEAAVVKDTGKAVELWLRYPSQNYITLEGDLLLSSGLLKLGAKKEGFFSLVQEIKTLKERISEKEKKIKPIDQELKDKLLEQQDLEKNLEQKRKTIAHLEKQIEEKEREKTLHQADKEKIAFNISTLNNELKIFGQDRNEMQKKLRSVTEKLEASNKQELALKNALRDGEREFESIQRKSEEKRRAFFELKSEVELLQEKIKNNQHHLQSFHRRKEILGEKRLSFQREIKNTEERKSRVRKDIHSLSQKIKSLEEEIALKEKKLVEEEVLMKRVQKEQKELEQRIEKLRGDHEARKEERVQWEIRKAEKDRDLANLEESCWQELKKRLDEVKKEVSLDRLKENNVQEKLEEAKAKLQKFSAVNLMAEEEYLSQKKRYDFLMKEKRDLRESIDTTKQAIKKIDHQSKGQFLKALDEINRNFQDVFALLFKGGKAELKLTDESNPMESGVEISAQPPGKKLQSLSLLSGGERSLTSLAFFFALFRYKPTPFCILDEVDAALDELNLERYLTLMRKIKSQTQFILITHNFKTMEVADYIYGTTMAEPNITTLYSVKLDKKMPFSPR